MIIKINEIPEGSSVRDQKVVMTEDQIRDCRFNGPVNCHITANRVNSQIVLRIAYSCTVIMECSRCLKEFAHCVSDECTIILQDSAQMESVSRSSSDDTNICFYSHEDETVDTRHFIFEDVIVSLPIKPLCNESCKGIDYKANDHKKDLSDENSIDPRWEALKKLKKK